MRHFPAVEITWPVRPVDDLVDRLLADIDGCSPTAVEAHASGLRVFFRTAADRDAAARILAAADPSAYCAPVEVSDEGWPECSQASVSPVTIGAVTVTPPWAEADARQLAGAGCVVVIQPSMGFGTGHHASTRLCLRALQHVPVAGRAVLDVGTGSGVLAIAARKLGASRVLAVDVDPDALQSARENLDLNGEGGRIDLRGVDLTRDTLGETFDVILANLTGAGLTRMSRQFAASARPGARLIASGFQADEQAAVAAAMAAAGWRLDGLSEEEEWLGGLFGRQ
jgi:ribosomal protein L11 methyltransferase